MTLTERKEQLIQEQRQLEQLLVRTHDRINFIKGALALAAELETEKPNESTTPEPNNPTS